MGVGIFVCIFQFIRGRFEKFVKSDGKFANILDILSLS